MRYLLNGKYVEREEYQKHLEAERKKLAAAAEKAGKEVSKPAAKEGGK